MGMDKTIARSLRKIGYRIYKNKSEIQIDPITLFETVLLELIRDQPTNPKWNSYYRKFKEKYITVAAELKGELSLDNQIKEILTNQSISCDNLIKLYCSCSPQINTIFHSNDKNNSILSCLEKNSILKKYTFDLSKTLSNKLVGREKEIQMLEEIVKRKNKSNAILLGLPGVGKTAIVEGLAKKLTDQVIMRVDITNLLSGTRYRGDFEERLFEVLTETEQYGRDKIILFIDEIHIILDAGGGDGGIDAGNILKPYLARGTISVIGATTVDEYNKKFKHDGALARRFYPIIIEEPDFGETVRILQGIKRDYVSFHGVEIEDKELKYIVNLTNKMKEIKHQPDKSIDILDLSLVRAKNRGLANVTVDMIDEVVSDYTNIFV